VAREYGVFSEELGAAQRATFVIDRAGTIAAMFQSANLGTPRSRDEYEAALAKVS